MACIYCGTALCVGGCLANAHNYYGQGSGNIVNRPGSSQYALAQGPAYPKKPLQPQETCVQALVGWRRWSVPMFSDILLSNNKTPWKPYEKLTANCPANGPSIADPAAIYGNSCQGVNCSCGIYAYKKQADAEHGENAPTDDLHIWGQVYLWGRVVEHETGYRAQYAYPKSLVNTGGIAQKLANVYGCKVIEVEPTPKPEPVYIREKGNQTATGLMLQQNQQVGQGQVFYQKLWPW